MRTEIDLKRMRDDESLNECEHFLNANLDRSVVGPSWIVALSVNDPLGFVKELHTRKTKK